MYDEPPHMNCRLVFDVAASGLRVIWFPLVGVLFVLAGFVLVFLRRRLPKLRSADGSRLVWFLFLFGFAWMLVAGVTTIGDYISMRRALLKGDFQIVEGVVQDFATIPRKGRESFRVGGQRFAYGEFIVTPCFHETRAHGGPVTEGVYVRIAHRNGAILRLEICTGNATARGAR